MTKFIVNKGTDAGKTDVNFFWTKMVKLFLLVDGWHKSQIHVSLLQ